MNCPECGAELNKIRSKGYKADILACPSCEYAIEEPYQGMVKVNKSRNERIKEKMKDV